MRTDCTTCPVRDTHCGDCIVPVLLNLAPPVPTPGPRDPAAEPLDQREREALLMLRETGLVTDLELAGARVSTLVRGLRSVG